jgi:hypothetical protein
VISSPRIDDTRENAYDRRVNPGHSAQSPVALEGQGPSWVAFSVAFLPVSSVIAPSAVRAEAALESRGQPMNSPSARWQRIPEVFATDIRPGADAFVYCKGCGVTLPDQPRYQEKRVAITTMMCKACQKRHGHLLMPSPAAPTFCFRCGGRDVIVVEKSVSPVTHHLCPRCVPARLARYRAGNFRAPHEWTCSWNR